MNSEYKKLISRIDDLIYQSKFYNKPTSSNFLSQEDLSIAKNHIGKTYPYFVSGGSSNYEYAKIFFLRLEDDIVCIKSKFDNRHNEIRHRDILGALMSLSINRNQVGDFFVEDEYIYIYTTKKFSEFLIENLQNIKKASVKFSICEKKEKIVKTEYFEKIISSQRVDNIIGAIMNCSRAQAQDIIKDDRVKINHIPIAEISKLCNNNCIISIRGKGRFLYKGIIKTTKKNKVVVGVEKYI